MKEILYWLCSWLFSQNFYSFFATLASLIVAFVAWQALETWKRKTRFEYATKLYLSICEYYNEIFHGLLPDYKDTAVIDIDNIASLNEMQKYAITTRLIYPNAYKKIKEFTNIGVKLYNAKYQYQKWMQPNRLEIAMYNSEFHSQMSAEHENIAKFAKQIDITFDEIVAEIKLDIEIMKKPLSTRSRIINYWKKNADNK
ncbi:MAG: hypothetical protein K0U39_09760 [Alphaproteobacteria bacterium]|nr:hypothetical protein [Alphaproteobacteria bacterium]